MKIDTNQRLFRPALRQYPYPYIISQSQQHRPPYLKRLTTDVNNRFFRAVPSSWCHSPNQDNPYAYTKQLVIPHYEIQEPPQLNDAYQSRPQDWVIERLLGGRHWCNQWVSKLCTADPAFLLHVGEQTQGYIHYLCLVRLAWQRRGTQMSIAEQAYRLRQSTQKSLLKSLCQPYPDGLLKTLSKLGHIPLSKNYYQLLVELQGKDTTRAYLSHATRIRPYHLRWLNEFPIDLLHISVLRSIKKASQYRMLLSIVAILRVLQKDQNHTAKMVAIKRIKTLSQLESWIQRFVQSLTFPPAPWPGNDDIKPISSAKALKTTANTFNNCIYGYARSVLLGYKYFYVCESGPAVIALKRDPLIGWHIEEINGVKNKKPDDSILDAIRHAFSKANFSTNLDDNLDALWDVIDDEIF